MKCFPFYCLFILLLCKYLSLSLCPSYYSFFMILCLFPRWVLDHLLMFVWEVPLGGRNFIPPRHLGSYFPRFIFMSSILFSKQSPPLLIPVIPFIFLHNPHPHPALLFCTYICLYIHLNNSFFLKKKKRFSTPSFKRFLYFFLSIVWVCLITMVDGKFLHFTFLAIYFLHFIIVVLLFFSSIMLP